MSKLERLSIVGIRSFGNQKAENIAFQTPLTLIVGLNGSGKTTIIECLKYATTGELPPNSKGGAFIHDPNLCGEKEVLGQVKMKFTTATGTSITVTRSIQLTVKKTTRTQKTLECSLNLNKNNERTVLSTRVAELDQLLPSYLGVSKAILESVIFCHQDESLWPMSEPSALKKKFDEIFEAQKYTKAIDNIKVLRKKQNEELGKFKIMEQHAKEDKVKADKANSKIAELGDEIEALREGHAATTAKVKEIDHKAKEAWNHVARYTEVIEQLKAARKNKEYYERDILDLQRDLHELSDSDVALTQQVAQYDERMALHEKRKKEKHERYKNIDQEIASVREKQKQKGIEAGKLEQQKADYEQKLRDRESEIRSSASTYKLRGYDELNDSQISDFLETIIKLSKEQTTKVERHRKETEKDAQHVRDAVSKLREQRSALNAGRDLAKEQAKTNDSKIAKAHSELEKITMDEAQEANMKAHIEELESKLEKAKQALSKADAVARIKMANDRVQELDEESAKMKGELLQRTKQAGELARLDHLKKESKDSQRTLDTIKGTHGARLQEFLGPEWDIQTVEASFQNMLAHKKQVANDAERTRDLVNRELEQVVFKLHIAQGDHSQKAKEVGECAAIIREKTEGEPEDYPENLAATEADRDIRKTDVDGFKNMKRYFSEAIETAQGDTHACRLCRRGFEDEKALKMFISRLEKSSSPAALNGLMAELRDLEADVKKAKEASKSYDTWVRLSEKELPSLKQKIFDFERQQSELLRRVEEHDATVAVFKESQLDAETLSKPVANMVQQAKMLRTYDTQIKEVVSMQDSGLDQSLEDIRERIEVADTKAKEQRSAIFKLQGELDWNRENVSAHELELGKSRNKLSMARHELEKKSTISSQIAEYKASNQNQREILAKTNTQLEELESRASEENAKLVDIQERGSKKELQLNRDANDLVDNVRRLQRLDHQVRDYIDQGGPTKLANCEKDIEALTQNISDLNSEIKQITIEVNRIQEELANQDQHRRVINDNLKFRKRKNELRVIEEEIEQLSAHNAEADQQRYRRDAERFQKEYQALNDDKIAKHSTMQNKDGQLVALLRDWKTDYKDAANNYKKTHIQVETTKAAVEDLATYGGALDKAIMKYHGMKMDHINNIIGELWMKTYQGTDVDTILIRSDNETAKGNRSYNYRVCMIKQDAEMDMRGRCSAGQKVLASIIIRLALAECFGSNCGMIALDEPTTNLDRANIKALAESLHAIIRHRMAQNNFQLIVITHDEEFLRYMKCADFCDDYWHVSRDDKQKSLIAKQSIMEVMA